MCERTVIEGSNGEQQGYGERTGGTGETDKTATGGFLGETGARRQAGRQSRVVAAAGSNSKRDRSWDWGVTLSDWKTTPPAAAQTGDMQGSREV